MAIASVKDLSLHGKKVLLRCDFNVPLEGGQQMYQALKSLGIDTQLIIYPDQFHGLTRPSFIRDRLERYLAWYDKYLKPPPAKTAQ